MIEDDRVLIPSSSGQGVTGLSETWNTLKKVES